MTNNNIKIEPGEITIVLADDMNALVNHACHMAKAFAEKKTPTHLVNAGMASRRFWGIARSIAPEHITERHGSRFFHIKSTIRGELYNERSYIGNIRERMNTKVLIICGWEWASKNSRLKQDLLFELRAFAEEMNMAIIVYSQASTDPVPGHIDRGGVGKIASIALSIVRIDEEDEVVEKAQEPIKISPEDEEKAQKFAQLVTKKINDLSRVRAGEEGEPDHEQEEVQKEEYEYA